MTLDDYIETHTSPADETLRFIEHDTAVNVLNPHMLSGAVQGRLLAFLSRMIQPKRILELGTFTGYSALCLAEGLTHDGRLITLEHNDELEDIIRRNLSLSPLGAQIDLNMGDALATLATMQDQRFDLCFIDADKREYSAYLDAVLPLMQPHGWILADNTLWDGHVIDPNYAKDKQTLGLRAFNNKVSEDERLEQVILPLRDGLTIIRLK
ncbi:MAG: O-methyltransferase [Paludibacteraceae bacterium]|nr:O-methyltransferase [Paludibacteraceae bacterium]